MIGPSLQATLTSIQPLPARAFPELPGHRLSSPSAKTPSYCPRVMFGSYARLILPHLPQMALCSWGDFLVSTILQQTPLLSPDTHTRTQVAEFPAPTKGEGPGPQGSSSRTMGEVGTETSHLVGRYHLLGRVWERKLGKRPT